MLIPVAIGPPRIDQQQPIEQVAIPDEPITPAVEESQTITPPEQPIIVAEAGSKTDWMIKAGIAEADWKHVEAVLGQESSWRLDAENYLGCIGLGQACPSGNKAEMLQRCPDWSTNGTCQMQVWNDYAIRRYGSWSYAEEWKFCTQICYNAHTGYTTNKKGEPWW